MGKREKNGGKDEREREGDIRHVSHVAFLHMVALSVGWGIHVGEGEGTVVVRGCAG